MVLSKLRAQNACGRIDEERFLLIATTTTALLSQHQLQTAVL
jgi:hypothetical protein